MDRSCVLAGSLNPGIIQPAWLSAHNVVAQEGLEWDLEIAIGAPTPVFRDQHLRWECLHNRLSVTAIDGVSNPGEAVAATFRILLHTPVSAVGNNLSFILHDEAAKRSLADALGCGVEDRLAKFDLPPSASSSTFKVGANEALLNLKLERSDQGVDMVSFNFHRACPAVIVANDSTETPAVAAASMWAQDEIKAREIMDKLLGGSS